MRRQIMSFMVAAGFILYAGFVAAFEFQPLGYVAMSMGGAGVASAKGPFAAYYNPALLARQPHGMQLAASAGVGVREVNLADSIDVLSSIDLANTIDKVTNAVENLSTLSKLSLVVDGEVEAGIPDSVRRDIATIKNRLRILSVRGNGLELMPSVSAGCQVGRFGFGIFGVASAAAYGVIDPDRLDMVVRGNMNNVDAYVFYDETEDLLIITYVGDYESRSLEYALNNKQTYLQIHGVSYFEVPIAYGHRFPVANGNLDLGGAFKIMPGMVYNQQIDIDTASGEISDEMEDYGQEVSWGVDLGLAYAMERFPALTMGLVGKNLNTPSFSYRGRSYDVEPQLRAGAAYKLMADKLTVALDVDITENNTMIPGYTTRFIGGGIDVAPNAWFSIRAGLMQNMQSDVEGLIYTAGMGLGLKWLQFDLAGQYSSQQGTFDGRDYPRYSRIQLALVSKWS